MSGTDLQPAEKIRRKITVLIAGVLVFIAAGVFIGGLLKRGSVPKNQEYSSSKVLQATVYNARTNPEDFYLPMDVGKNNIQGKAIAINGKNYVPYKFFERRDYFEIHWKSKNGIQKIVVHKQKSIVELYENVGIGWEIAASAEPKYQFFDGQGWRDYTLDFSQPIIESDVNDELINLTLAYFAIDKFGRRVPVSSIIKIGFDGDSYINAWDYHLAENNNINRLVWNVEKDYNQLIDYQAKQPKSYLASVVGGMTREVMGREIDKDVVVSVDDFIKQNNGRKDLVSVEGNNYYFYPEGKEGEMLVDPVLRMIVNSTNITVQTNGFTSDDFSLYFNAAEGGLSQGFLGIGESWGNDYIQALFTELDQDSATQASQTSVVKLIASSTSQTIVRNSFTLIGKASVVEDYYIYPSGKIVKKTIYDKTGAGTESRQIDRGDTNFVAFNGYGNSGGTPDVGRGVGTYTDTQILRLNVRSANSLEVTDYQNADSDLGVLKGSTFEADATTTAGFNTWDGSYGIDLTATDTATFISDLDGATNARYDPVFTIRGWASTSTPNYVANNGISLTSGTDYNVGLMPIAAAYYATSTATTTLASGGDTSSTTVEYLADVTNNFNMMDFLAGEALYLGFHASTTGFSVDLATSGVGGTLNWQYCSAVIAGECSAWTNLAVNSTVPGASNFTASGMVYWPADNAGGWVASTVSGIDNDPSLFYLKSQLNSGSFTTKPVERQIASNLLVFQYLGNITTDNNSFIIAYADKVSAGSGGINTANTWTPSGVPLATQNVLVQSGHTITLDGNGAADIKNLFVASGGTFQMASTTGAVAADGTLTLTLSGSLISSGATQIIGPPDDYREYNFANNPAKIQIISSQAAENGIIVESVGTFTARGQTSVDSDNTVSGQQRNVRLTRSGANNAYIYLKSGSEALIENTDVSYMGVNANRKFGIFADGISGGNSGQNLAITGSLINNGYDGVVLANSTDITLAHNWFFANQNNGIKLATSSLITIYGNVISSSTAASLEFQNSTSNQIISNTFDNNVGATVGILADSNSNVSSNVIQNTIVSNSGIGVSGGGTMNITYSLFNGNSNNGITVSGTNISSAPFYINRQTGSSYGNNADDFALATSSAALAAGSPSNTNIGGWLGYIKNVTDNTVYGVYNSAAGDPSLGAGDTVTTYAVNSGQSTSTAYSDLGEFLQVTAASEIVSSANQYAGQYAYFSSGSNQGYYYLIVGSSSGANDAIIINASTTSGFAAGDAFTIVDRVYTRQDNTQISFDSSANDCGNGYHYCGYAMLNLQRSGSSDNPITWNASGPVILDSQTHIRTLIMGVNKSWLTFDGFILINSAEYTSYSFGSQMEFVNNSSNITARNIKTFRAGGGALVYWGANSIMFAYYDGGTAPSNIVIDNVESYNASSHGFYFVAVNSSGTVFLNNIAVSSVKAYNSDNGSGLSTESASNLTITRSSFYNNGLTGLSLNKVNYALLDNVLVYSNGYKTSGNGASGLNASIAKFLTVKNSAFFGNKYAGINIAGGTGNNYNTLRGNRSFANQGAGIRIVANNDYNYFYNNTIDANQAYGIYVDGQAANDPNYTWVQNNLITNNITYGLREGSSGPSNTTANYNYYYNNASNTSLLVSTGQETNSFFPFATLPGSNDVDPGYIVEDSGTVESGSVSSLTDTDKNWATDQWVGYALKIASIGGGATTTAIVSNSSSTLTLAPALSTAISNEAYTITGYYISSTSTATANTPFGQGVDTVSGTEPGHINIGSRMGFIQNTTDSIFSNSLQAANDASGLSSGDSLNIVSFTATSTTISSAVSANGDVATIWVTVPDGIITADDQFNGWYLYIDSSTANYPYRYFPILDSSSTEDVLVIPKDNDWNSSTTASSFASGTAISVVDRVYNERNYTGGATTANARLTKSGTDTSPIVWSASTTGDVILDAGKNFYASSTNVLYIDGARYNQFVASTTDLVMRGASAYEIGVSSTAVSSLELRNTVLNSTGTSEVEPITLADSYVISFKHDQTNGDIRIWGEYTISSITPTYWKYANSSYSGAGDENVIKNLTFMQNGDKLTLNNNVALYVWGGQNISKRGTIRMSNEVNGGLYSIIVDPGLLSLVNMNIRDLDDNGIQFTSVPSGNIYLQNTDFSNIGASGVSSTAMTIAGSAVIKGNRTFSNVTFTGIESGDSYASTTGGTNTHYWYFSKTNGEGYDLDNGDPGMLIWNDSAPVAPTIGAPTSTSATTITWEFTDNAINETGFTMVSSVGASATTSAVANLSSLTETELTANTQYTRFARVDNSNALTTNAATSSASASLYTLAPTPSGFYVSATSSDQMTLTVDDLNNPASDSSGYFFNRASGGNSGWIQTNSWVDSGLSPDTQYSYAVAYRNGNGYVTASTTLSDRRTAAATPGAPTLSGATINSVNVAINANGNPASITYAIQETGSSNYVQSNGTLGASADWQSVAIWGTKTVTGLSAGTTYTFKVKAKNSDNVVTDFGATASLATAGGTTAGKKHYQSDEQKGENPTHIPVSPNIINSEAINATAIRWRFADADDNEAGFRLKDKNGIVLADKADVNLEYIDETKLSPNKLYSGRQIFAYNNLGESQNTGAYFSETYTLAATPTQPKVDILSDTSIKITIDGNGNPDYTDILIKENNNLKYVNKVGQLDSWVAWQTLNRWGKEITLTGLETGKNYSFVLKARNEDGIETNISSSTEITLKDNVPPVKPVLNYPINGAILRTPRFTTTGASEPDAKIILLVDDKQLSDFVKTDESGMFSYELTSDLSYSEHKIEAIAQDAAGNVSPSAVIFFTIKEKPSDSAEELPPSSGLSTWALNPESVKVGQSSRLTIIVRDEIGRPLAGHLVKVISSGLERDTVKGVVSGMFREVTDENGKVEFDITSTYAHLAILSVTDETDSVLLTNNINLNFSPADPFFLVLGSSRYILKAKSIFTFQDSATIEVRLEDKFQNVIKNSATFNLSLDPRFGSLSSAAITSKDGVATVKYSAPDANLLPGESTRITVSASYANINGELTLVIVRAPTSQEAREKKIQDELYQKQLRDYEQKVKQAKEKGLPMPEPPQKPKKVFPLPVGLSAVSGGGTVNLSPDELGRITVVAGQSFEINYKPKARTVETILYVLSEQYPLVDEDGDGIYEVILSFGQQDKNKEVTMLVVERYANGEVNVTPITVLIDPYGYVYTRVNTDPKQPIVLDTEQRVENARVLLYWQNEATGSWQKWPSAKYYQENPIFTNKQGEYSFMVPEGNYYLTANRDGYQFYRSEKVLVENAKPVNLNIFLSQKHAPSQRLKNFFNLIGIRTNLPDYAIYLFAALGAILVLGVPLIIWLSYRVVKDARKKTRAQF